MELLATSICGRSMIARGSSVVVAFRLARERDTKHSCGHYIIVGWDKERNQNFPRPGIFVRWLENWRFPGPLGTSKIIIRAAIHTSLFYFGVH